MSKMKLSKDVKSKQEWTVYDLWSAKIISISLSIYVLLLFAIYPLYYRAELAQLGEAKWDFYKGLHFMFSLDPLPNINLPGLLPVILLMFVWFVVELIIYDRKNGTSELKKWFLSPKDMTITDMFVLAYGVLVVISMIFSPYRKSLLWGVTGWRMGFLSQMAFVSVYFLISRFWNFWKVTIYAGMVISAFAFIVGILNQFRIDPLNLIDEDNIVNGSVYYISTMGNTSWYSSYVSTVTPLGIFLFWFTENKKERIFSGIYCVIAAMTMITHSSDSAFLSLVGIFSVMIFVAFDSRRLMENMLETLLLCLLSWRVIGFLQMAFPEKAVYTMEISTFGSQHPLMWLPIAALAVILFLFKKKDREENLTGKESLSKYRFIAYIYYALAAAAVVLVIVYIALNTSGALPASLSTDNDYLKFGPHWGNWRGLFWMCTTNSLAIALRENLPAFLIGYGPDSYTFVAYVQNYQLLSENLNVQNTYLTNSHNEWYTMFLNQGVLGGIAYMGIFLGAVVEFIRGRARNPWVVGCAMCAASYFMHNLFCYQQMVCTPFIFTILGIGAGAYRWPLLEGETI